MPEMTRSSENDYFVSIQICRPGNATPLQNEANPDFPTETEPVCILNNLGDTGEDTFITVGPKQTLGN